MITASPATDLPLTPATIADEQIGLNGAIAIDADPIGGLHAGPLRGACHRGRVDGAGHLGPAAPARSLSVSLPALPRQRGAARAVPGDPGWPAPSQRGRRPPGGADLRERRGDLRAGGRPAGASRPARSGAQPGSQPAGVEPASLDRAAPGPAAAPGHRPGGHRQRADRRLADEAAGHDVGLLSGGRNPDRLDRAGGGGRSAVRPVSVRLHVVPVHPGPAHLHDRDHGRPGRAQPGRRPPLRADLPGRQGHPARVPADEGEADDAGPDPRQPHQLRHRPGDRAPGAGHPR